MSDFQTKGSNSTGWARIQRRIENWELYFSEPFTKAQAWIDLFTFANHKQTTFLIRGNVVTVERGEIAWSEERMATRYKWSRQKVRRFLELLETRQQIKRIKTPTICKILIIKYDEMQSDETTDETTERRQKDGRRYTYNNDKNDKNDKNIINNNKERGVFTPPSLTEVSDYCLERKNQIDPESFLDFYSSKGWMVGKNKMKDWRAAIRTWEKRDAKENRTLTITDFEIIE